MTQDAAAASVGTVRQVWRDWEIGRRVPDPRFMGKIYQFTRGAVTPNDFYELPPIGQLELPIEPPAPTPLLDMSKADDEPAAGEPQLQAAA